MINYRHNKLVEVIASLNKPPTDPLQRAEWIKAGSHLAFLRENALSDELVIYSLATTFIDSIVVPNVVLKDLTPDDLTEWQFNAHNSIAGYVSGGGKDGMWIERGVRRGYDNELQGTQLVFRRTFEGLDGPGRNYIEINQEYTHLTGIHWRQEKRAHCRFDIRGDLEPVVSITVPEDKRGDATVVTFKWEPLEEYLTVYDAAIVRRFDFTMVTGSFGGWSADPPEKVQESNDFYFRQKIMGGSNAYTSGIQVIRPRRPTQVVVEGIKDEWFGKKNKAYVAFVAQDWRNNRVTEISTDPSKSTNYFEAGNNSLPFELSPAFFRPEVLSKYKTDRDKYTIGEREVSCRAAWHLKGIDVNEAGQVHAYICDLRSLPYEEQLHWLAHNEPPKATISKRAFINDFQGEFVTFSEPLQEILSLVRKWHHEEVLWWKLRDEKLLERVSIPLSASRDEWAEAFMDLAKLVVEGFETTPIRTLLNNAKITYTKDERTITLLEKLIKNETPPVEPQRLAGLRTAQDIRSKVKGHASGDEGDEIAQRALLDHESFANHFRHVCKQVLDELHLIERLVNAKTTNQTAGAHE